MARLPTRATICFDRTVRRDRDNAPSAAGLAGWPLRLVHPLPPHYGLQLWTHETEQGQEDTQNFEGQEDTQNFGEQKWLCKAGCHCAQAGSAASPMPDVLALL